MTGSLLQWLSTGIDSYPITKLPLALIIQFAWIPKSVYKQWFETSIKTWLSSFNSCLSLGVLSIHTYKSVFAVNELNAQSRMQCNKCGWVGGQAGNQASKQERKFEILYKSTSLLCVHALRSNLIRVHIEIVLNRFVHWHSHYCIHSFVHLAKIVETFASKSQIDANETWTYKLMNIRKDFINESKQFQFA